MTTQANANNGEKARNLGKFLKGVRSELKKVNWPNRKELTNNTIVVVVSVALATLALWALDSAFGFGLNLIIR
ncbi:preprotein translocase subunit SecE [Alkaliphilus sp. MSJ-5]|uniref:Protein translocase subunit SecE n=1 Tax=Alkaliphilus flagellatus TaxID=2841507 RepID=A0ABS6G6M3_9FIRM|nr:MULTISPECIES: preprotein translocase subunit SecE [Alkaliphilus]MBU5678142.1 preprotein translocase subunit SecE [Alkaliphilus flagellatus]QUH19863.1 preprotein translocase subunit SecE [Alkaliphilus sp. B6464]